MSRTEGLDATRVAALGGLALFAGLVALQHPLRPDLPPAEHFVSEYANGRTAPLQVLAFVAWAAATAAGARLVARARPAGRRVARALATGALLLAAAGMLTAAAFATQTVAGELPAGTARTAAGRLHDLGTLGILVGLGVAAAAAVRLVRSTAFRLATAALAVALLAVVPVLMALGADAPGLGQRAFIAVGCLWQWQLTTAV